MRPTNQKADQLCGRPTKSLINHEGYYLASYLLVRRRDTRPAYRIHRQTASSR